MNVNALTIKDFKNSIGFIFFSKVLDLFIVTGVNKRKLHQRLNIY